MMCQSLRRVFVIFSILKTSKDIELTKSRKIDINVFQISAEQIAYMRIWKSNERSKESSGRN